MTLTFFNVQSLNNGISCDPNSGEAGGNELSELRNLILTIFTNVFTFFLILIASSSDRWKLTKADRIMTMMMMITMRMVGEVVMVIVRMIIVGTKVSDNPRLHGFSVLVNEANSMLWVLSYFPFSSSSVLITT